MLEQAIGELPGLAAQLTGVPLAVLRIFDQTLVWAAGIGRTPAASLPELGVLSELADFDPGLFEIADVATDARTANCAGAGGSAIRFFASAPILTEGGRSLGALHLIDRVPRRLESGQRAALLALARQAAGQCRLLEELQFARALAMSAPVALYHSDMRGNVTYTNAEYRRIFRLEEDHTADAWSQSVHPEDRARMQADWADFCRNPRPRRFEYRTEPTAGRVRYFAEQVVAARGMSGFIGTISDFTDLVAARADLIATDAAQKKIPVAHAGRHVDGERRSRIRCGRGTDVSNGLPGDGNKGNGLRSPSIRRRLCAGSGAHRARSGHRQVVHQHSIAG